ncbi:DUF2971 domain-containing protein [Novosphingobium sp. PP1Y]|uniref:DUF2971 domain-containing protein n=1 Tax=Novosphingobium sp. PP1Y TaxID=702113 RepID=UPI00020EEE6F|nr:DUF2971 domain-containing protein [Novosphingobium sp. PP1Y]CCA89783.1 conserved hypothetical protein [Novosphingobium sp. PP1Y]
MALDEKTKKLLKLVFSYDAERADRLRDRKKLLAHYTTADTAMKILSGRTMWLRNAGVMNDFLEIDFGRAATETTIKGDLGARLYEFLDGISDHLGARLLDRHEGHRKHARETVFMSSLSEHDPNDLLGRLSMWRAYGGPVAGVALLFRHEVITTELDIDMDLITSPVLYGGAKEYAEQFEKMVQGLEAEKDFLAEFDPEILLDVTALALQMSMLSLKHPGFEEEQEWRVIHRPYEFSSSRLLPQTITIGGIPQAVYELPFHNPGKDALFDIPQLDLKEILAGIIIGPCLYPETVFRAFRDQMVALGQGNPVIHVSHIPLRQKW